LWNEEKLKRFLIIICDCFIIFSIANSQLIEFSEIPQNLQFYARDENNKSIIPVSGFVLQEGFEQLHIKLYRNNIYTLIKSAKLNYENNQASFNLQVPISSEFAEYSIEVYLDTSFVVRKDSLISGDVFIINGQSNSHPYGNLYYVNEYCRSFGRHTNYDAYNPADTTFGFATGWGWYNTPFAVGAWGIELMRLLVSQYPYPVFILNGGSGGSTIEYNLPLVSDRTNLSTTYGRLLYRAQKAKLADKVKAIMWHQGESNSTPVLYASYGDNFDKLYKAWHQDYPSIEKVYVFQNHPGCGGTKETELRETQRKFADKYSDVRLMSTMALVGHDGCHYAISGYNQMASWIYKLIARDFYYSQDTSDICPANVLRVYYLNKEKTKIGIDFDQKINYPADYNGYSLKDYFYFDKTNYGIIKDAYLSGERSVVLELDSTSSYANLTYLPSQYYNNSTAVYQGPWITGLRGIGALSFDMQKIEDNLEITEQPLSQELDCSVKEINFHITTKGLIRSYQWQKSVNKGITWTNIAFSNNNNLHLSLYDKTLQEGQYRCIIKGKQFIQPDSIISNIAEIKFLSNAKTVHITSEDLITEHFICDEIKFQIQTEGNPQYYLLQLENQGKYITTEIIDAKYQSSMELKFENKAASSCNYRIAAVNSLACGGDTVYSNSLYLSLKAPFDTTKINNELTYCINEDALLFVYSHYSIRVYQWYKDNTPLTKYSNEGYNKSQIILEDMKVEDEGKYYCKVQAYVCDSLYEFNSPEIFVQINSEYKITNVINNATYSIGDDAEIEVQVQEENKTQFKWYRNNAAINESKKHIGVNTSKLIIDQIDSTDFKSYYHCITSQNGCSDTTGKVKLHQKEFFCEIANQTQDLNSCEGDSVFLLVEINTNYQDLHYNWYKDDIKLEDSNFMLEGSNLIITEISITDAGIYILKVLDGNGNFLINSQPIDVIVEQAPNILSSSENYNKIPEESELTLFVESTNPLDGYQWYKNSIQIENATNDTLVLKNCSLYDVGNYFCKVSNQCGTQQSEEFNVEVIPNSIKELNDEIIIYPNPANEYIVIVKYYSDKIDKINIFDILGTCVKTIAPESKELPNRIDVSTLAKGVYYLQIGCELRKMLIVR